LGGPKADRARAQAAVHLHAPVIEALRRGVSRPLARRRIDWEKGLPGLYCAYTVGNLATCQARFLLEAGQSREAAELLLDTVQFGLDLVRAGDLWDARVGMSVLGVALGELRGLLVSGQLNQGDYLESARELEVLDRGYPQTGEVHVNDAMAWGFVFLRTGSIETYLKELEYKDRKLPTWRSGFSDRILMADDLLSELAAMRRKQEATDQTWSVAWEVQSGADRELEGSKNPLVRLMNEQFSGRNQAKPRDLFRERRAQPRLLRMAAQFRATGGISAQDDPFGGKMKSTRVDGGVRVWSIGPDGTDDGGVGEWNPGAGKDIVLDVER
jgi:hypothetical protein